MIQGSLTILLKNKLSQKILQTFFIETSLFINISVNLTIDIAKIVGSELRNISCYSKYFSLICPSIHTVPKCTKHFNGQSKTESFSILTKAYITGAVVGHRSLDTGRVEGGEDGVDWEDLWTDSGYPWLCFQYLQHRIYRPWGCTNSKNAKLTTACLTCIKKIHLYTPTNDLIHFRK